MSVPTPGGQPAFSPDGRTLAVNHEDAVVLLELATGCVRHEFRHHGTVETALVWRPDGRAIAAASSEAPIYLWDVAGNQSGALPEWDVKEDERRWAGLCGSDAPQAFETLRQFLAHPAKAIAFLKDWMPANSGGRLAARGCEALELIANPDARRLLGEWAAGPVDSALTVEAKDSLRRLGRT
jgi:WD40 repeat protein